MFITESNALIAVPITTKTPPIVPNIILPPLILFIADKINPNLFFMNYTSYYFFKFRFNFDFISPNFNFKAILMSSTLKNITKNIESLKMNFTAL